MCRGRSLTIRPREQVRVGTSTLTVHFTPQNTSLYNVGSAQVPITVTLDPNDDDVHVALLRGSVYLYAQSLLSDYKSNSRS